MIIAEIGQAHDGSVGIAHSYIDALKNSGVDAVKFQTHIADAESSVYEKFRIPFSYVDKTRYDYWRRMEFDFVQWAEIKSHCEENGLEFISSPFSQQAVELLEKIGVKRYKIASGEMHNYLMIDTIAATKKPIIMSTGMATLDDLDEITAHVQDLNVDFSLLQCTTKYPTQHKNWGLNMISIMKDRYNCRVGYSDHSGEIYSALAAAACGADIIEFHVVFHKHMFGPDAIASIGIDDVPKLTTGIKQIKESLIVNFKKDTLEIESKNKLLFAKSLCVRSALKAGHVIQERDLETKKPAGYGISPRDYKLVCGKKIIRDLARNDFINYSDII